ncbi:hypothetical protein DW981_02365 [Clostridium sp. AM49-4BH]|nr:hypothetical protein DW981_02365 [Clostridium sp. AM49-4BH]
MRILAERFLLYRKREVSYKAKKAAPFHKMFGKGTAFLAAIMFVTSSKTTVVRYIPLHFF